MDFRQLRYFVAIVEAQSFSRAAMVLNVAQPALSLHVRNMEADLGTALLLRTPQGVLPTDAGKLLLTRARHLLQEFEKTLQAVRDFESEAAGEVHIGLPGTIAEMLSVPLILRMRKEFPHVHLKVAEAMSGFVLSWLHEGRVDLGLLYTPVSERGLKSTPILNEELRLFAGHPLAAGLPSLPHSKVELTEIVDLPLVLPGKSHGLRALIDSEIEAQGLELSTVIE
ncbi:MAG: LysR family transcriptional regulator, partial [Rhodobacterales bacterium]